ncbi:STAS domain-containing protein [Streptomyces sp. NPDC006172]|uniref:STAS domain-containing protein n=1 Tax=Streptomyces sp. NPDC006172 TaxID=3154470 RepID=UPI0033D360A9
MSAGDEGKRPFDQVNEYVPEQTSMLQYERNGVLVVVAPGACDLDSIAPLADALETAAAKQSRVVVDASGVSFADSTFLNLVLHIHRLTELRLAAPPPQLRRVLELTGADAVLDVRATIEDATN